MEKISSVQDSDKKPPLVPHPENSNLATEFLEFFKTIEKSIQSLGQHSRYGSIGVPAPDDLLTDDQWFMLGFLIQKALFQTEPLFYEECDLWFYGPGRKNQIWQTLCHNHIREANQQCYIKKGFLCSALRDCLVKNQQMEIAIGALGETIKENYDLLVYYKSAIDKFSANMCKNPELDTSRPNQRGPMVSFPFKLSEEIDLEEIDPRTGKTKKGRKKLHLSFKSFTDYKNFTIGIFDEQTKFLKDYRYQYRFDCYFCYASALGLVAHHGSKGHKGWAKPNWMNGSWIDVQIDPIPTKIAYQEKTPKLEYICKAIKAHYFPDCKQGDFSKRYERIVVSLYAKSKSSDDFEQLIAKSIVEAIESYKQTSDNIIAKREREAAVSNLRLMQLVATNGKGPLYEDHSKFTASGIGTPTTTLLSSIPITEVKKNGKKLSQKEKRALYQQSNTI